MQSQAARNRTLTGLRLLEDGLGRLGWDPAVLERIGFGAHGRPEIAGGPSFSIAHSGALVACALSAHQIVGLDVEARRQTAPARLARRLGSSRADRAKQHASVFFDDWCVREATVKASGRVGFARIRGVTPHGDTAGLDGRDWWLRALDLAPGYAACLASDRPIETVTIAAPSTNPHRPWGR